MALMKLKCGAIVEFDEADVDLVFGMRWTLSAEKRYAVNRRLGISTFMHRLIMQPGPGMVVDHIDGNGLNNRRANLRVCTHQENLWNRKGALNHGVYRMGNKWRAHIDYLGKKYYLGMFDGPEHARQARDWVARRLRGEFAPEFTDNVSFDPSAFPPAVRELLITRRSRSPA